MGQLVLTHGASSNRNAPLLVALDRALAAKGITVTRYDLPYRQERQHGPPRPSDAERDQAGLRTAVEEARKKSGGPVWLGGHSYGGRQSSMLIAEEPDLAEGLLLLSYPLHPPGKPDRPRTGHLPKLRKPVLFVHGSKDPFGSLGEMREAIRLIPAKTQLIPMDGAGHDLGRDKAGAAAQIAEAFAAFVA